MEYGGDEGGEVAAGDGDFTEEGDDMEMVELGVCCCYCC